MIRLHTLIRLSLILAVCWAVAAAPAIADEKANAQEVVDKMTESFNNLKAHPNMGWFRSNLKNAKAVMILNHKVHNPGASELVTAVTELASAGQ